MKKRIISGLVLAGAAVTALASCGKSADVFHVYCWNDEFRGFFEKYISDEQASGKDTYHLDGKEVKWTKVTSDNGAYQQALDEALANNAKAKKSDKVDMFLAEADYILKYSDSDYTKDIKGIGVTDFSNAYQYTVSAASDAKGTVKGVSFQCCPSGMIYRTDIAKEVLGIDSPEKMQEAVSTWEKWEALAPKLKEKGYYITGSYADSYRVFSNNAATPWVKDNTVTIPTVVEKWMDQADRFVKAGYTKTDGVWDAGKTTEFLSTGKAFCTFGPAWYYNFCMGEAMNGEKVKAKDGEKADADGNLLDDKGNNVYKEGTNTYGKWAVIQGPQAHFWGGTWAMAATGGDDDALVAKVMNACLGESFSTSILKNEGQFSNNKKANEAYAKTNTSGNGFLGGQNDTAIWVSMADNIKFENITNYDQYCNEGLQTEYVKYLKGTVDKDTALASFKSYMKEKFPTLK